MNPSELLVIVALNTSVAALLKSSGKMVWQTDLPGIVGDRFVTLTADASHVFAYAKGKLHCLDTKTDRVLWTNELKGFGYGIASVCVPGVPSASDPTAYAQMEAEKQRHPSAGSAD